VPADVPADVPPLACRSDRDCSARMQVCERAQMLCVDCNTAVDCTGTEICSGNRCVPAPPPCRSDRDCSARMQVCNTARMLCVDCNTAVDCPPNNVCNADGSCAPQVCVPSSVTCADTSTVRVCSADGRSFTSTTCPAVANGVSRCGEGACTTVCNPGFADCDGNGANGCETPTTTVTNCRACGTVCRDAPNATATCTLTGCGLACDAGYGNCDGNAANGCERSVATDVANCGACGRTCGAGQTCVAGACTALTCTGGAANCDGNVTNGCETTPATDVASAAPAAARADLPTPRRLRLGHLRRRRLLRGLRGLRRQRGQRLRDRHPHGRQPSCGACGNVCALPRTPSRRARPGLVRDLLRRRLRQTATASPPTAARCR
jgi:hypothetical protein